MKRNFYSDTIVLITGASTGIGRELTLQLVKHGATVFAVSRNSSKLQGIVQDAKGMDGRVVPFAIDISDFENCKKIFEAFFLQFKRMDLLINNAGIGHFSSFTSTKKEDYEYIMKTNFMAPLYLTQLFFNLLKNSKKGRVINICSNGAFYGIPFRGIYCASKAAMRAWSQALSLEFQKFGIEVFTIIPGSTKTDFFDNQIGKAPVSHRIPGKIELPEKLARRILRVAQGRGREFNCSVPNKVILYLSVLMPWLLKKIIKHAIASEEAYIYKS